MSIGIGGAGGGGGNKSVKSASIGLKGPDGGGGKANKKEELPPELLAKLNQGGPPGGAPGALDARG